MEGENLDAVHWALARALKRSRYGVLSLRGGQSPTWQSVSLAHLREIHRKKSTDCHVAALLAMTYFYSFATLPSPCQLPVSRCERIRKEGLPHTAAGPLFGLDRCASRCGAQRLLDLLQMPIFSALAISSSRNCGWAMEMMASERCQVDMPLRLTMPYSVTR